MKVFEFAKQQGLKPLELMDKIKLWKLPVKSHMSVLSADMMQKIENKLNPKKPAPSSSKKRSAKKTTVKKTTSKKTSAKKSSPKKTVSKKAASSKVTSPKKTTAKTTTKKSAAKKTKTTSAQATSKPTKKTITKKASATKAAAAQAEPKKSPQKPQAKTIIKKAATKTAEPPQVVSPEPVKKVIVKKAAPLATPQPKPVPSARPGTKLEPQTTAPAVEGEAAKPVSRRVVRRRAAYSPQAQAQKAKEQQAVRDEQARVKAARKEAKKATTKGEAGIVGHIDLSVHQDKTKKDKAVDKVTQIQEAARAALGVAPGAKPGGARGTGRDGKDDKKTKTSRTEVVAPSFNAADFRKREIMFQPKKKRVSLTGEAVKKTVVTKAAAHKRVLKMHNDLKLEQVAQAFGVKSRKLMQVLKAQGVEKPTRDMVLDFDTVSLLAMEFDFKVENAALSVDELLKQAAFGDFEASPTPRPPVVCVMGHVDHGKTTLLDTIRKSKQVDQESGGITQHIGAYKVTLPSKKSCTFIDTPGHEAFTAMRSRGAHSTDIVILVVAAGDGVMPQTKEAISHARAAKVPIVVAVNKMDAEGADAESIKRQLAEQNLVPEDWGGDTIFCPVSALKATGIQELLEQVMLVAEVQELKANAQRSARGVVLESHLSAGRGHVATVLVQEGELRKGQIFVAGTAWGRVRQMMNDEGVMVKQAGPSDPVQITGFEGGVQAGDAFDVTQNEADAREVAQQRRLELENDTTPHAGMSLEDLFAKVQTGETQQLPVILKTDVAGTAEAIEAALKNLDKSEVKVKVIHSAVGAVSETDVQLAVTAGAVVVAFHVRPTSGARNMAKQKGVEIKSYTVIYNLIDDIKKAMQGLLAPDEVSKDQGKAEVRETFKIPKVGVIAGCSVVEGKITRHDLMRLVRDGKLVHEGKVASLRRVKDEVKEVVSGFECGVGVENFNDIKVGDVIEVYKIEHKARTLEWS